MSLTGLSSDPNGLCKNSFHCRNNSGELDVFEAARYFSEIPGYNNSTMFPQNFIAENRMQGQRAARMSLDMPMMGNSINSDNLSTIHQKQLKDNKKYKQPSSPGGRLASFLNTLLASKKKKKSKSSTKDTLEEDQSPGGRKRRSSISHFRTTTTTTTTTTSTNDSNSSSSGFITPPTYAKTPTKLSYKDFQSLSDHQKAINAQKNGANSEKRSTDYAWLDDEFRFSNGNIFKNGSFRNSVTNWIADDEDRGFRKFNDVDDGADTDSSSDLFDLPNHDLDLPVYGTTHMDRIRIGAPISSAATA